MFSDCATIDIVHARTRLALTYFISDPTRVMTLCSGLVCRWNASISTRTSSPNSLCFKRVEHSYFDLERVEHSYFDLERVEHSYFDLERVDPPPLWASGRLSWSLDSSGSPARESFS